MKESLALFDQICNSKWFQQTSMIVFLNKIDLFQTKLKYSSLSQYFPDFKGNRSLKGRSENPPGDDRDYNQASRFFQKKFIRLNRSAEKEVYTHFTNATGFTPFNTLLIHRHYDSSTSHGFCTRHDYEQQFQASPIIILGFGINFSSYISIHLFSLFCLVMVGTILINLALGVVFRDYYSCHK